MHTLNLLYRAEMTRKNSKKERGGTRNRTGIGSELVVFDDNPQRYMLTITIKHVSCKALVTAIGMN